MCYSVFSNKSYSVTKAIQGFVSTARAYCRAHLQVFSFTMSFSQQIRERVEGTNASCKFEVCKARREYVTRAILEIAILADRESKICKTSEAYDEINRGQDKAIRLFENCCIYGFFTTDKDFETQAMYVSSKGHFQSIIKQLGEEGPYQVHKSTIIAWVRAVATDLENVQHMTNAEMMMAVMRNMPRQLGSMLETMAQLYKR